MCFKKQKFFNRKAKIAKKDIKCFKVLELNIRTGEIISPCYPTLYFENNDIHDIKEIECKFVNDHASRGHINQGIHSFSTYHEACLFSELAIYTDEYNAIIPKGTLYYYNSKKHEYVSEKLIVYNKL
jgi:hypothetical protein